MSRSLQASALSFLILSIGHTIGGKEWTAEKVFTGIKGSRPWACGTVGWYQGSAFFLLTGILHYQWSCDPSALSDPLNKAMAAIVNVLLWSSTAWYAKNGIKENAFAVGLSAALQGAAVLKQIL
ncbi:hypothetical protein N7448_008204 [Penicillium atrosanguineum]|uniref:Uncharacterized protein n=1 Tax=Penicillium atrosanguineum TaxID=1132637 RepID=A0A9W9KZ78_9EURO|nr:Condensin complex subunit 2 [Penicillium atrosanguineum]KAJ5127425.1 hypothetical protein N7448_008204 [Penicillium atrosanguineum]KAJ5147629.1 hypothetical protein N7526_000981 [Penicillium atrosanguineum]KAJ5313897.1 Condensin complex subunit 2 [Penicillium atrosanguineum]KAJ5331068.1 hypothetical protein N7476_000851 [Penicillium atrosanguineum]